MVTGSNSFGICYLLKFICFMPTDLEQSNLTTVDIERSNIYEFYRCKPLFIKKNVSLHLF